LMWAADALEIITMLHHGAVHVWHVQVMLMDSDGKPQRPLQPQEQQAVTNSPSISQPAAAAGASPHHRHLLSMRELLGQEWVEDLSSDTPGEMETQVQQAQHAQIEHRGVGHTGVESPPTSISARRSLRREAAATKLEAPTAGQIQAAALSSAAGVSSQGGQAVAPQASTKVGTSPKQVGAAGADNSLGSASGGSLTAGNASQAILPRFYLPHVCWNPAVKGLR
jgi:hypothetical protein